MNVIPAIDVKDGKCVRLYQGDFERVTEYSSDPAEIARQFAAISASDLHIVDLDGAFAGKPKNAEVIHAIAEAHPDLRIQIGGGIRDEDTIAGYLDAGVSYVIIGTKTAQRIHCLWRLRQQR